MTMIRHGSVSTLNTLMCQLCGQVSNPQNFIEISTQVLKILEKANQINNTHRTYVVKMQP